MSSSSKTKVSGIPFLDKIFRKQSVEENRIEGIIDPDTQLEKFRNHSLELLDPIVLYKSENFFNTGVRTYSSYHERPISVVTEDQMEILNIITQESFNEIKKLKLGLMHLGLITIGMKGMARP